MDTEQMNAKQKLELIATLTKEILEEKAKKQNTEEEELNLITEDAVNDVNETIKAYLETL